MMHYNKLRRFIENKLVVSDELFEALNKIERFSTNAVINSTTQTKINIVNIFYYITLFITNT